MPIDIIRYNDGNVYCDLPCLKGDLIITPGNTALGTIENYVELYPEKVSVSIININELQTFAENLQPFYDIGFLSDMFYIGVDAREFCQKIQDARDTQGELQCRITSLDQLLVSLLNSPKKDDFAASIIAIRKSIDDAKCQLQNIIKGDVGITLTYDTSTLILTIKDGQKITNILDPNALGMVKLIENVSNPCNEDKTVKKYYTIPKIDNKLSLCDFSITTLAWAQVYSRVSTCFKDESIVSAYKNFKMQLGYSTRPQDVDLLYKNTYLKVDQSQNQYTLNLLNANRNLFDVVISVPGPHPIPINTYAPDTRPDHNSRVELNFFIKDSTGKYIGSVLYNTRFYTIDELKQQTDEARVSKYIDTILQEIASPDRTDIFQNKPGQRPEKSFLFREGVKIFSQDPVKANVYGNVITNQLIILENILKNSKNLIGAVINNDKRWWAQ